MEGKREIQYGGRRPQIDWLWQIDWQIDWQISKLIGF
jgi:hypothetical protein